MTKGIKKSDPIIDYPEIQDFAFEHIDEWLEENKDDEYLIKLYCSILNQRIIMLLKKLDDNSASIIRRAFKLLEKWEK
jgi:hypothetical protein